MIKIYESPDKGKTVFEREFGESERIQQKNSHINTSSELSDVIEQFSEQYKKESDDWWDNLSYEDKLKAFYSVCYRIYLGDVDRGTSYRGVLYDVFNFGPDAYLIGVECNYMNLHNYIQTGVETESIRHGNFVIKGNNHGKE